MCARIFVLLCAAISAVAPALAQSTTTVIYGTVTDSTGAVVPNARVTAVNSDTNLSRSAETNSQGEYRIEILPIGHYEVRVDASGFQKFIQSGIVSHLTK